VRDLRVQKFLRELVVGVAAPSDLTGSIIVEILHSGEGGNVEQVARISKQMSCVCDCLSLSFTCIYILHAYYICAHLFHAWYSLCLIVILVWIVWYLACSHIVHVFTCLILFVLTLVFNQERYSSTSTLNLEESWGDSPEPFTGNSASLFDYILCVCKIVLVCIISLILHLFSIWLARHLFTPL